MIYEDNYMECKALDFALLEQRNPKNGTQVQDWLLYDTDESKLTERERLVAILPAIAYEVDHGMLTEELEDELYFYHQDLIEGKLDEIMGDDEADAIREDIMKYFNKVFGNK